MKKLLLSSILGIAALAVWAAPSHAWTFGLIPHHCWPCGHGCGKCCDTICIRPYNAFSPTACGSMCFDGCNPFCGGGFPGFGQQCCQGYGPGGPVADSLPNCDGCTPAPGAAAPTLAQPAPSALPAPATRPGPVSQAQPYGGPVPAAGAYGYAPTLPQTVMPAAAPPYYYGGYGR